MATPTQIALRELMKLEPPITMNGLPDWMPPSVAEQLISDDLIRYSDIVRSRVGEISILDGVTLTPAGVKHAKPKTDRTKIGVWIALAVFVLTCLCILLGIKR